MPVSFSDIKSPELSVLQGHKSYYVPTDFDTLSDEQPPLLPPILGCQAPPGNFSSHLFTAKLLFEAPVPI